MPVSDFLANSQLNHLFTDPAYTPPATLYVALSTTAPANDGTNVTEPSGNAYARVATAAADWNAASARSKANGATIQFPTATGSWGVVTHFAIYDAVSGGNMLWSGALTTSRTVSANDAPRYTAGQLSFSYS